MGMTALLFSLGTVVLAEMGDKTQLLAMAFAAKYKAGKVMAGVLLATVLNHGLAVAVGNLLMRFQGAQVWIQGIAALSFIFFGLWTIRGDRLDGEQNRATKFGAVMTVAIAFFVAEMGDKTQLATVALATRFPADPVWILAGTTVGMLVADGIGIIVGVVMCKRIPERTVKVISAGVFIFFGLLSSYQVMRDELWFMSMDAIMAVMTGLYIITAVAAVLLFRNQGVRSAYEGLMCRIKGTKLQ